MAKPFKPAPAQARPASPISAAPAARTEVRNSPLPKSTMSPSASSSAQGSGKKQVTYEQIARRAYEIWQSGKGGSDFDNWVRAERELRGS
jgi:hypothetical protein